MSNVAIPLLNVVILGSFMLFCVAQVRANQMNAARQKIREDREVRVERNR